MSNPSQYISKLADNRLASFRTSQDITNIVITWSGNNNDNIDSTISTLLKRGASVHYTVDQQGTIVQHHPDIDQAFFAGISMWKGKASVNQYGIGVMLIGGPEHPFAPIQIERTIELLKDINTRHNTTFEIVGIGEVAFIRNGAKNHVAPGLLLPWKVLAQHGLVKHPELPENIDHNCQSLNKEQINQAQEKLKSIGYRVEITGELDNQFQWAIETFKSRYIPEEYNSPSFSCWNEAADFVANELLGVSQDNEL